MDAIKDLMQRHEYILKTYILNKNGTRSKQKRDIDVIKEHHRFLWTDDADADEAANSSWEGRLARRYYDKLFREYCIADLSHYKTNKVALRWRTEAEVVTGKGQFQCGSRRCEANEQLRSWEVNFAYDEHGERKNALVKLRLCPEHSGQLNYTSKKREVKRLRRRERRDKRKAKKSHRRSDKEPNKSTATAEDEDLSGPARENQDGMESSDSSGTEEENPITAVTSPTPADEASSAPNSNEAASGPSVDIWSRRPEVELEPTTRETDFERYLEDLLL